MSIALLEERHDCYFFEENSEEAPFCHFIDFFPLQRHFAQKFGIAHPNCPTANGLPPVEVTLNDLEKLEWEAKAYLLMMYNEVYYNEEDHEDRDRLINIIYNNDKGRRHLWFARANLWMKFLMKCNDEIKPMMKEGKKVFYSDTFPPPVAESPRVNLSKGQKVDLTKANTSLKKIMVGLGWDTNKYSGGDAFDLDATAFLLNADGKVAADTDFVFYNNLEHPSKSVKHMGDNRTGEGEGDDEQIMVDLSLVPANIEKIAFAVTIHDAEARKQTFGQVSNAFIRIVDAERNTEICRYDLGEDFSTETAVVVGEIYRRNGEWKFGAIGGGFNGGLEAVCKNFGVNV